MTEESCNRLKVVAEHPTFANTVHGLKLFGTLLDPDEFEDKEMLQRKWLR